MKFYSIPRRTFLKTSAAAAVVPNFFTNAANAADADKIRVASIGVGGRGTHIGKQAASLEQVVACVDVHDRNANRFAEQVTKQHGGEYEVYDDYRRVLDRKDIHAITCGTPDHWYV
jgi:predicted TIM-barrel enzyme